MPYPKSARGVTLIELVMVMVILAIVSSVTLIFMQRTFVGYGQARDRLMVASQGRLALNRIKRDLRLSLPNSVRLATVGGVYYLEFAPVSTGGRYRVGSATGADTSPTCSIDSAGIPDNGVLTIGQADACFKTLGPIDATNVAVGDWVVVFNAGAGYVGSNYYEGGGVTGGNKAALTAISSTVSESKLNFASNTFSWDSPGHRFYLAKNPITYACDPVAGTMTRWSGYAVQAAQPTTNISSLSGVSAGVLVNNLTACQIVYTTSSIANQFGLVTIFMRLSTPSGDPLNLQVQSQVSNLP